MAKRGKGQLDEIIAGPRTFQQRAKQHEQENHRCRHAKRNTEHAFGLHPEMPACLVQGRALPAQRIRENIEMPEHHIKYENSCHNQKRQPKHAIDSHQNAADTGNREEQVEPVGKPGPVGDVQLEDVKIEAGGNPDQDQPPFEQPINRRRYRAHGRIHQQRQPETKGKVDLPGFLPVEDELQSGDLTQEKRKIRDNPELEQRPQDADAGNPSAGKLGF